MLTCRISITKPVRSLFSSLISLLSSLCRNILTVQELSLSYTRGEIFILVSSHVTFLYQNLSMIIISLFGFSPFFSLAVL